LAGAAEVTPSNELATRHYIARSRAACEAIDYTCPAGATPFLDESGCGCETRPRQEPAKPR